MDRPLPTTVLGRTGLTVTRLGIGGAYCPTVAGYRAALDTGVTYVDTARAYRDGDDERVVGEALVGRRQDVVLATKTMSRDAAGARKDLETSLRLLRTDYVDVWQIHYLNTEAEREQALGPGGAMEAAVKAREQGLVRHIGVTGHNWPEIAKAVGIEPVGTVPLELADGSVAERSYGFCVFAYDGETVAGNVVIGPSGCEPLAGTHVLQDFRIIIDLDRHEVTRGRAMRAK